MSKQTESEEENVLPKENTEEKQLPKESLEETQVSKEIVEEVPTTPIKQRNKPVLESRLSSQKRKEHEAEMHSSWKKKQHIQRIVFSEDENENEDEK